MAATRSATSALGVRFREKADIPDARSLMSTSDTLDVVAPAAGLSAWSSPAIEMALGTATAALHILDIRFNQRSARLLTYSISAFISPWLSLRTFAYVVRSEESALFPSTETSTIRQALICGRMRHIHV
jgi:hypothetical protein